MSRVAGKNAARVAKTLLVGQNQREARRADVSAHDYTATARRRHGSWPSLCDVGKHPHTKPIFELNDQRLLLREAVQRCMSLVETDDVAPNGEGIELVGILTEFVF